MSENNNKQKRKRVCPHCGRKLWMREFYPLKNGGRSSWCHECVLEYKRERYRKTRKVPDGTFMHRTQGRIVEHNGYSTRIFWNGNMLSIMRRHYHNTLNRELAEMLGVSERLPVDRQGYVEVEENWAYLYEKGQKGNRYIMAINTNRNSVVSVEVIHQKRNVDSRTSGESEGKFQNDTYQKGVISLGK